MPAIFHGQSDRVIGDFLLIYWENMADPIITGRDDLGFGKLYCELPDFQIDENQAIATASWDGCEFARLELTGKRDVGELPVFRQGKQEIDENDPSATFSEH